MFPRVAAVLVVAAASAWVVPGGPLQAEEGKPAAVQIGMIQTLFRGSDSKMMLVATQPFGELLHAQTGIRGQFSIVPDAAEMAKRVDSGELHLGILHGIEYAWIKEKYPDLQPLILAHNQTVKLKGYLLVRADSKLDAVADLKGKPLALPRRSLNHCHLFLHRTIQEAGHDPAGFFAAAEDAANTEVALDAVVDGTVSATVVDGVALDVYRKRKPARAARLRILKESGIFPTATIVYKPGARDEALINRFRDGLVTAHQQVLGRQILTLWRLSQFSEVPTEYQALLDDILKEYPDPVQPARFSAEPATTAAQSKPAAEISAGKPSENGVAAPGAR